MVPTNKPWDTTAATAASFASPWSQSLCAGSTCSAMDQQSQFHENLKRKMRMILRLLRKLEIYPIYSTQTVSCGIYQPKI